MKAVNVYLSGSEKVIRVECKDGYNLTYTIKNETVSFFNKDLEYKKPDLIIASFSLRNITHWEKVS